jgi:hypothetical protein
MNRHFNRREQAVGQKRRWPNGRFWREADGRWMADVG